MRKKGGAARGNGDCVAAVADDGKCGTYFLPSVKQIDKMRSGIGHQDFRDVLSTGRRATQTTEANAAPDHSDDRTNKVAPILDKVKAET